MLKNPPQNPTSDDLKAIARFILQTSYDDGIADLTLERGDAGFTGRFVCRTDPKRIFEYEIERIGGSWQIGYQPISGVEDDTEDFTERTTTLPIWNSPPFDFAENTDVDPADILSQKALEQTGPIFQDWLDTLESHLFDGATSLEEVRDRVESVYQQLDAADFAATMQQVMLLGYGTGRYLVLEEVSDDVLRSGPERPVQNEEKTEFNEIQTAHQALQYLLQIRNTESISLLFSELSTDVMELDFSESDNLILTYAEIGRRFTSLVNLELEWLDFAAATKKGPKRNCKTGFPCGSSCITRTKSCRNPLEGQFKTAAEWLESQVKKPDPTLDPDPTPDPTPPKTVASSPTTAKEFIELGEASIPEKFLRDFEEFKNGTSPARQKAKAEYDAVKQEMIAALDKRLSEKKMKPIRARYLEKEKAYFDIEHDEHKKLEISMEEFRQSLKSSGLSKKEATDLVNKINFEPSYRDGLSDDFSDKDLKDSMVEFYMLTGGQGSDSLKSLVKESDRAWANQYTKKINIGKGDKRTMFHEMAHHVEFEDEILRSSAREWIEKRAEGPTQKLKDLTGVDYEDGEKAFPDKFIDPYVGKDYGKHSSTEVISMGIEHFTDSKTMLELYKKDPEHFAFILGAIKRKRANA